MKINVTKLSAARSQLIEAINLFFEERDPVSIHTLASAALQILNDHVSADEIWKTDLLLHYDSIYIKEDMRKLWNKRINEAKNFFKHADKDLKDGKISIEFETNLNELIILEAIRCLKIIEGNNFINSTEFIIFTSWYTIKHPDLFSQEIQTMISNFSPLSDSLSDWKELMCRQKLQNTK